MRARIFLFLLFLILMLNANAKWSFRTGGAVLAAPLLDGERIYAGSYDGIIYAVSASSGELIWSFDTGAPIEVGPVLAGKVLVIGNRKGNVYALDPGSGTLKWSYNTSRVNGLLGTNSLVYISSEEILALDPENGRKKWVLPARGITTGFAASVDTIFIGSGEEVLAIDAVSGKEKWAQKIGKVWKSNPAYFEKTVYIGSTDGRLYALEAGTGNVSWFYETNGWVLSTPLIYGGNVYFGSNDGNLYALDARGGRFLWKFRTGEAIQTQPAFLLHQTGEAEIIVGSNDGKIYSLDARSGEELWNYKIGSWLSSPVIKGKFVIIGAEDKFLYYVSADSCSIEKPRSDEIVGDADFRVIGKGYAVSGVREVQVRVKKGSWRTAEGTREWNFLVRPEEYGVGNIDIECRVIDKEGNEEPPPYTLVSPLKKADAPLRKMNLTYPSLVSVGENITIEAKDEDGFPLTDFEVRLGGESRKGSGKIKLRIKMAGANEIEVSKKGYETEKIIVQGKGGFDLGLLLIVLAIIIVGAIAALNLRKKKAKPQPSGKSL